MSQLRLSTSRRRGPGARAYQPVTEVHEKPEHPMSVPLAIPMEPLASLTPERSSLPILSQQALAKARWIAESDPRVSVAVAKRSVVVSTFVSKPHSRSGGWTLGIRYMTPARGGPELLVSAVVDLFAGEILSLVTFDPMTGAGGI